MRYALLFALPLAACGGGAMGSDEGTALPGGGGGGTRTFVARDFDRVEARGPDDVEIRTGADFSVRAEGSPAVLERLEIRKVGNELRIGRKSGGWDWGGGGSARVFVTMPEIRGAAVAGSGNMAVDRAGSDFNGSIAGSGDLTVGMLTGGEVGLSVAGSGTLSAAGTARALDLSVAGSGDIKAQQLRAEAADVSVAGSGNVTASVNGPASVSVMGSGDVDLGPTARCEVSKLGSGTVTCGG